MTAKEELIRLARRVADEPSDANVARLIDYVFNDMPIDEMPVGSHAPPVNEDIAVAIWRDGMSGLAGTETQEYPACRILGAGPSP